MQAAIPKYEDKLYEELSYFVIQFVLCIHIFF